MLPQLPRHEDHDDGRVNHAALQGLTHRQPLEARYTSFEPSASPVPETDDIQAVMQVLQVFWRNKSTLLSSLLAGIFVALGVSLCMAPIYRATSSLEIQTVREMFSNVGQAASDTSVITESRLLASEALHDRVSSKLKSVAAPQFPKVNGPLLSLRAMLGLREPAAVNWSEAVEMAGATLVVQPVRDSQIITIQSESTHPLAAADFANRLTEEYIQQNQEERWEAYQKTSEWLNRAQGELKSNLEKSEKELADFAKSAGLILTSDTQNMSEGKLVQLQAELGRAAANRIEKQAIIESSSSGPAKSLPEVLDSGPMEMYQTKLADLRRQLVELTATLTPEHYRVIRLQAQIDELEAAKEKERSNIAKRMTIQYDAAQKRENELQKSFNAESRVVASQTQQLIYYNILKREVETNKALYQTTLQKGKEASVAAAMSSNNARVIDAAKVPHAPYRPSLPFNLTLGGIGGLFFGAVFVIVRFRSDVSIHAPGTLGVQVQLRELGVIPSAKTDPGLRSLTRRNRSVLSEALVKKQNRPGNILFKADVENPRAMESLELVTLIRRNSMVAEAIRATMASILTSKRHGVYPKVLLLTSPSAQEGKTTLVSNLGIALAEIGQRVLLIDGDMRLPRLHNIFDVPNTFGLSDILNELKPLDGHWNDGLVRKTSIPGLHVLPAGPARPSLSRLLYSPRMKELMEQVRNTYDIVLIDSAPVLSVPDARILAFAADAVILVVRAHKTSSESALAAAVRFEDDGQAILGTILNDWNPKTAGYYGSYGYYDSYAKRFNSGPPPD